MKTGSRVHAWLVAAAAAATISTLVQIALWIAFTDAFPAILARDARLAAALVLGNRVLPPPATFDAAVMLAALFVHTALSLAYAAVLAGLVEGRSISLATIIGAAFGAALYPVNMYVFTAVFPWFAVTRDWITAAAHVAFFGCLVHD